MLVQKDELVEAHLLPTVNYPPKLEKIVLELLAEFNATGPQMPDGSGRRLRLYLGETSSLQVAIVS